MEQNGHTPAVEAFFHKNAFFDTLTTNYRLYCNRYIPKLQYIYKKNLKILIILKEQRLFVLNRDYPSKDVVFLRFPPVPSQILAFPCPELYRKSAFSPSKKRNRSPTEKQNKESPSPTRKRK